MPRYIIFECGPRAQDDNMPLLGGMLMAPPAPPNGSLPEPPGALQALDAYSLEHGSVEYSTSEEIDEYVTTWRLGESGRIDVASAVFSNYEIIAVPVEAVLDKAGWGVRETVRGEFLIDGCTTEAVAWLALGRLAAMGPENAAEEAEQEASYAAASEPEAPADELVRLRGELVNAEHGSARYAALFSRIAVLTAAPGARCWCGEAIGSDGERGPVCDAGHDVLDGPEVEREPAPPLEIAGETLGDRLERLRAFTSSSQFALTEQDVANDYLSGDHRYALGAIPPRKGLPGLSVEQIVRLGHVRAIHGDDPQSVGPDGQEDDFGDLITETLGALGVHVDALDYADGSDDMRAWDRANAMASGCDSEMLLEWAEVVWAAWLGVPEWVRPLVENGELDPKSSDLPAEQAEEAAAAYERSKAQREAFRASKTVEIRLPYDLTRGELHETAAANLASVAPALGEEIAWMVEQWGELEAGEEEPEEVGRILVLAAALITQCGAKPSEALHVATICERG